MVKFIIYLVFAFLVSLQTASAAKRVALVVGNGQYDRAGNVLLNPANDARQIGAKLEELGVEVITVIDQDFASMRRSLSAFANALEGADAGIFYYAGHGMEYRGTNYLFPVDAAISAESDVRLNLIAVDLVMEIMEAAVPTRLVFLDACRDNPMARSFARGLSPTRSGNAGGRGLAGVQASVGSFIAYATAPGDVASDGQGSHSPFTAAMLKHLDEPGLEISQLMRRVRNTVLDLTDEKQVPWESSSLRGAPLVLNQTPANQQAPGEDREDIAMWMQIEESGKPEEFRQFLERFPTSPLAGFIQSRLRAMQQDGQELVSQNTAFETAPAREQRKQTPILNPAMTTELGLAPNMESGPKKAGEVFNDCELCPEVVAVKHGGFVMGSQQNEAGREAHEGPTIGLALPRPLAFGRLEVTFDQWDMCVANGGCDGYSPVDEGWGRGDRPVINVNHQDAKAYTQWLSSITGKPYRLPSEAEWEYAARAGIQAATPWSVSNQDICSFANIHDQSSDAVNSLRWSAVSCDDGSAQTAVTGSYMPNGFGLHDMLGNVWEWTNDCYAPGLDHIQSDGSAVSMPDCAAFVVRGGGWRDRLSKVRLASRSKARAASRTSIDGFRIVRDLIEGLDDGSRLSAN